MGEFLEEIKKEFGEKDKESRKVIKVERKSNKINKLWIKSMIRDSRYKQRLLVKELKRRMDEKIRKGGWWQNVLYKSINQ